MNLKLKVYRLRGIETDLPWRWVVIDTDYESDWWLCMGRWSWPRRAVIDSGRAPDGVIALRIGLYALVDAHRDHLVGAE